MLRIEKELPEGYSATAIAIGKFDSLHLGHQQLIHELTEIAEDNMLASGIITFDRHPNVVLNPEKVPAPILGPTQRIAAMEELGLDFYRVLEFDRTLADRTPEDFVREFVLPLGAKWVLVGTGFRFGKNGSGDISTLKQLGERFGFRAKEVANVMIGESKISTTLIRSLLDQGKVAEANLLLGRNHQVTGLVEHGRKLGRKLGFPTANIARDAEGYLPADGVYAGYLYADGERYPAAHSVGTNDSIAAVPRLLESHVIGRDDLDLYDRVVTCEFVDQVRGWAKFESVEKLTEQIASDVAKASELLKL